MKENYDRDTRTLPRVSLKKKKEQSYFCRIYQNIFLFELV